MKPFDYPVILLAAGGSSRMRGRDKMLEEIDGKALLARQAGRVRAATTGPVLVALPPRPHPRYDVLSGLAVTPVPVANAAAGMNASLCAAFAGVPEGADYVMVLLADLPDITEDDIKKVGNSVDLEGKNLIWRGATEDRKPGHPIVFHASLFPALRVLRGDEGAKSVVASVGDRVALVPLAGTRALDDLDTPEAWEAWRANRQ